MAENSKLLDSKHIARQWARILPILSRVLVWGMLFLLLFVLRSFFLLIFLTFVFAYIQTNGVNRLEPKIPNRTLRVIVVGLALLTLILALGAFIVPRVKEQARIFANRYPQYLHNLDSEIVELGRDYPVVQEFLQVHFDEYFSSNGSGEGTGNLEMKRSLSGTLIQQFLGLGTKENGGSVKSTLDTFRNISAYLLTLGSAFLLSLLFSFLIVLDLPSLTKSVRGLRDTKIRFIYDEVANSIKEFATVLGRALEAQLFIAIVNTVFTGLGLLILGLDDKIAFLSLIVFLCSFIPVAGVFISSVPILLVALQESGFGLMLLGVAMITVVHMIEAYILNPRIYGHHLRLNPVVVLIILTVGGKIFHVWGLVLGVPVCVYIFNHAIRHKAGEDSKSGTALERELINGGS